jgi:hypothetical protein
VHDATRHGGHVDPHGLTLLIGTKRGLFISRSDTARRHWQISPPKLTGREFYHAIIDERDRTA